MVSNVFNEETNLWTVDETGSLGKTTYVIVGEVLYFPSAVGDDLVFQSGDSVDAIVLKAGASDTSPIHENFRPQGLDIKNIKCSTIDGGTAYVRLL